MNDSIYFAFARAYREVAGLPIALRPLDNWQLLTHARCEKNSVCALMSTEGRTCAVCLPDRGLEQGAVGHLCTVTCACGLTETAGPLRLADETIGFLQTGQVFCERPTAAQFARVPERVEKPRLDVSCEKLEKARFSTPIEYRGLRLLKHSKRCLRPLGLVSTCTSPGGSFEITREGNGFRTLRRRKTRAPVRLQLNHCGEIAREWRLAHNRVQCP